MDDVCVKCGKKAGLFVKLNDESICESCNIKIWRENYNKVKDVYETGKKENLDNQFIANNITMLCKNCNKEIDKKAEFCRYCGHKVEKLIIADNVTMLCKNCNKEIDKKAEFCSYCGHKNEKPINAENLTMLCKNCNKEINTKAEFCSYCGQKV